MNFLCRVLHPAGLILFLMLASQLLAQDPGTPDTVRVGAVSVNPYDKFAVPVFLYNDEVIQGITIPLVVRSYSGRAAFDSVSFAGGRLSDPSILDSRMAYDIGYGWPLTDSILIRLRAISGSSLPAGEGKLCDLWFSAWHGGQVDIDSTPALMDGALEMESDATLIKPQFVPGAIDNACNYIVGDVRNEGGVSVSSILGFWKSYYGCLPVPYPNVVASDVNCDRWLDMRDLLILRKAVLAGGTMCQCGSYAPSVYEDPGLPDTIWIVDDTLIVGVPDTVLIGLTNDEPLAGLAIGLEWDGTANLDFDENWGAQCVTSRVSQLGINDYVCSSYADGTSPDTMYFSSSSPAISSLDLISPGSGVIFKAPFTPLTPGEVTFRLIWFFPDFGARSMLVTEAATAITPWVTGRVTVVPATCGDANGDRTINIGDAVYIVNYVFKGGPAPQPVQAGDANCDSALNVGDAVYIINYIFKGGPAPCCP